MIFKLNHCFVAKLSAALLLIGTISCSPVMTPSRTPPDTMAGTWIKPGYTPGTNRVVLLKLEMEVLEVTASGVIEHRLASKKQVETGIRTIIDRFYAGNIRTVPLAPGSAGKSRRRILSEHLALFDLIAGMVIRQSVGNNRNLWRPFHSRLDYSIGKRLGFVARRTGARFGLIITGTWYLDNSGRNVTPEHHRIQFTDDYGVKGALVIGMVDLRSGNLVCLNYRKDPDLEMDNQKRMNRLVQRMLSSCHAGTKGLK